MKHPHAYKPQPKINDGFTLVEVSIVLVIIGLIIGGILVGQDLITSSKIRKIGKDFEQYNTAVHTFRLKYNCLAGDCLTATNFALGTNGDGDGTIDYPHGSFSNTPSEPYYFFQHLSNALLVPGQYNGFQDFSTPSANALNIPGVNVPKSPMSDTNIYLFYYIQSFSTAVPIYRHIFVLGDITGVYPGVFHNPALFSPTARELDTKFDDGKPYTGKITNLAFASATCTTTGTTIDTTALYVINTTDEACIMVWEAQF